MSTSSSNMHQPKQLYWLFSIEVWERFGFYTIRALLVLYLTKKLSFSDDQAYGLFSVFTALIWLTPMAGGILSDKYLGRHFSIVSGILLLALGYILLGVSTHETFYLGLSIVLVGIGFFKPAMPGLVGNLYPDSTDPRREGGFTIYYMGINLGGILAGVSTGIITAHYSWNVGFFVAGVGMLIAFAIYFQRHHTFIFQQARYLATRHKFGLIALSLLSLPIFYLLLVDAEILSLTMLVIGLLIIGYFLVVALGQEPAYRNRMLGCLLLTGFSVVFWALYQQAPMTVTLFSERNVNTTVLGLHIPVVSLQACNPIFIFLFTPLMNALWTRLNNSPFRISTAMKFTLGTFLMSFGFLILAMSVNMSHDLRHISAWWVIVSYGIQSLGELFLSPIGLAMMTAMAPKNRSGMMLGLWFFSSAVANTAAGPIAKMASIPKTIHSYTLTAHIYQHAFSLYGWISFAVAIIALLFTPMLSKLMTEAKTKKATDELLTT